ncbi:hypothetical protein M2160_000294 [Streptomyces sp. SAI-117]|uniref:hypothetical protein n=1 Tax=Streptomyces sp. SAI-117 TaxID=2940546 RepID=UPI002474B695|nr:hypothetical protein [Streptomyces sp. SAI-117]MDH6565273.1 hypothetical protein [Streptomyces sp. SAI-117]
MIRGRTRHPRGDQAAALGAEAEGYLLARSHRDAARREAGELCARMPWLTTAQAEDVTRHYCERRMMLTRHMLHATVQRAEQLRQEYETRYQDLRRALLRRHAACASALLACAAGAGAAVGVLTR